MEKIYLKLEKDPTNIVDLINSLYGYYGPLPKSVATYSDKECTIVQCNKDKYRSFEDLILIVNTYFPNTEEREILEALLTPIIHNGYCYYLHTISCADIKKITIGFSMNQGQNKIAYDYKRNGRYSWKELFELIEVNTFSDMDKIIKKGLKQKLLQEVS